MSDRSGTPTRGRVPDHPSFPRSLGPFPQADFAVELAEPDVAEEPDEPEPDEPFDDPPESDDPELFAPSPEPFASPSPVDASAVAFSDDPLRASVR